LRLCRKHHKPINHTQPFGIKWTIYFGGLLDLMQDIKNVGFKAEVEGYIVDSSCLSNHMQHYQTFNSIYGDPLCKQINLKGTNNSNSYLKSLYAQWAKREESMQFMHDDYDKSDNLKRFRPSSPIFRCDSTTVYINDEETCVIAASCDDVMGAVTLNCSTVGEVNETAVAQSTPFYSLSPVTNAQHSQNEITMTIPSPVKRKLSQSGMLIELDGEVALGQNKFIRGEHVPWKMV
jgi:hypothetical protein